MEKCNERPFNGSVSKKSFADDDIVITGISGRFPLADNMQEFKDNLYSKRHCIVRAENRWSSGLPDFPNNYVCTMKNIDKFDAEFFNLNFASADGEDPQFRMLYEVCYEAIIDAGYDPKELANLPIGVFVGQSDPDPMALERNSLRIFEELLPVGFMVCMSSNKLSHRYNLTGPSFSVDTACSSSASALEEAFGRMKNGTIVGALVGCTSLCLDPRGVKSYLDLGILSPNGENWAYDARANGFVMGEAVSFIFIQKKKDARRIYAKIHNVECSSADFQTEGVFVPSSESLVALYNRTYGSVDVNVSDVGYIEGHAASKSQADELELKSIEEAFCKDRKTPLLLGTVKSNIGNTEASSALCSIFKVILAFEMGTIAPTINHVTPNPKCSSLRNGKIQVVTEVTPYDKTMAAINSFGYGGAISHVVLERNQVRKPEERRISDEIPKLVVYAATTEDALISMFDYFRQHPMPNEFFALLNKSAYIPPGLACWRGVTIIKKEEPSISSIERLSPVKRPIWYIVTGTSSSQWTSVGLDLMKFEAFEKSINNSAKILEPFGIDLLQLLSLDDKNLPKDKEITPTFVTNVAIQIALVDVLEALDLKPDGIIGHSTGELVCSYADGCCTAEQTILSAYYIASSVESADLSPGAMATVGLSSEEAKKRCPEGVFVACHDEEDIVTVSGPTEAVEKFVEQLKSENIFASVIGSHASVFYSRNKSAAIGKIRSALQKIYTSINPRSKRWLSTSYCKDKWTEPECELADANYFCHNIESEVHFKKVLSYIPTNAILIEIGQQLRLKSTVTEAVGSQASYIELLNANEDNVDVLLSSIGKLYNLGLDPQVENLYEPVSYPVPTGTPMISPFVKWDHSKSFIVPKYQPTSLGKNRFSVKTSSTDKFLLDHCIEGRSLYPATGYIYLAWKALSENLHKPMEKLPVCIENFKILRATILNSRDNKDFDVRILHKSGYFEISEGDSIVASGRIYAPKMPMFEDLNFLNVPKESSTMVSGKEIYNELKIHGYEYGPSFQGLLELNMEGSHGFVMWNNEWIPFLDSLLLFFGIIFENTDFMLPTGALSVKIDPYTHMDFVARMKENEIKGIPVRYDRLTGKCATPGVEIRNLKLEIAPHRLMSDIIPMLEEYSFTPYDEKCDFSVIDEGWGLDSYVEVCNKLAKQIVSNLNINGRMERIFNSIKFSKMTDEKEYYFNEKEDCMLQKSLRNILEMSTFPNLCPKIQEACRNISDILVEDVLFKSMLHEKPLRTLLDVAVENSFGKISVIEWFNNSPMLLTSVQEIMKSSTLTKTNYFLLHSNAAVIDAESLTKSGIQVEPAGERDIIPPNFKGSCHLGVTCCMAESINSVKSRIRTIASLTKEEGFILVIHKHELIPAEHLMYSLSKLPVTLHSETEIEHLFEEGNLTIISKKSSPFGINAYLLRKIDENYQQPQIHVVNVLHTEYTHWIEELKNALFAVQEKDSSALVLLVSQDTISNGIVGLTNCLKQEPGGDRIRCIFTDSSAPSFDLSNSFYQEILKKDLLMNVYMNGSWGSFRHTTLPTSTSKELTDCAYVECVKPGDLASLLWLESPVKRVPIKDDSYEFYHVYYSSLNFRDVMFATAKLSAFSFKASGHRTDAFIIGMEFSGRDRNGRRIMGIAGGGSICNTFRERTLLVMDVPDKWSLEEAATVPVVYSTCYYALILRGELEPGEKVLIHSGTGGVGQAAIRIALGMNCEIFTTVGTPEKRDFLMKTFPQLKPENIGCSRDTSFENMVMKQTKGQGVDFVLNSLADDKFQASIRCLGYHGRFLEIGKYDLQLDNALELHIFEKGISFISCQIDTYYQRTQKSKDLFAEFIALINDGIRKGVVQPLGRTVFQRDEVEKAFRYMGSGKHIGKVIIKVREEETEKTISPSFMRLDAYKNFGLYNTKSYIIIGGLGGFGIELAKWMVQKGAGTVILTSRYGARTPYHHFCLKRWHESGAHVLVSTLDVSKRDEAQKLLEETQELYGPVGGIFNSAVVLKDAFIENQTASAFEDVCAPKALATTHLDELTRIMCPELDMFVCFSSISCGKGNAGQTNYGYANSVMERICEKRKQDGLHGLAVQWGIIGEVGLVHRRMGDDAMIAGVMAQKIKSCLQCLEKILFQDKAVVSSFVAADKSRLKKNSDDVLGQLAKIFGVPDIEQLNPYRTLGEMGIDSMVGVELRQLLQASFDVEFSLQQMQNLKIEDIKKLIEDSKLNKNSSASQAQNIESININDQLLELPTEPVVKMNSVTNGEPLFVIHGNDHLHQKLTQLYEGITVPVFALQSTKDTPINSLEDMSLWYLTQIERICGDSSVHLSSISSSGNLVLEMAIQSQKRKDQQSRIRSLTILDGSLDLMEGCSTTEQRDKKTADVFEAHALCEFLSVLSDSDLNQLKAELELLPTLESRINMICNLLTSSHKASFAISAEIYTKKQNLMRFHMPSDRLHKDLTLIEATEKVLPNDVSTVKSFMKQVCDGHVTIHRVVGSSDFLFEDRSTQEVAALLNNCLKS